MIHFFRRLIKPKYQTLNLIEISEAKLINNLNYLKSCQPTAEIFPVLKANAYGHGLREIAQILNKTEVPLVVVDSYPEAQIVYRYFKRQVLILGEMPLRAYHYTKLKRTQFVVYNEKTLKYLSRYGKKARVHLFINSGMNREGIKDLTVFIERNRKYLDRVDVVGLCSHLASAEEASALNQEQEDKFIEALDTLRSAGYFPQWVHLGNSAALFTLDNKLLTAYRPGLALYGYSPLIGETEVDQELQPILEVFSHIVSIQSLLPGESVSYNESYHATQPLKIGIIPFGYFEGLDRRLSNQAQLSIQSATENYWAKIAGRVCMNLTCLEIERGEVRVGDLVKVVSADPLAPNSAVNLARLSQIIIYEFLVRLQSNIRREIVK